MPPRAAALIRRGTTRLSRSLLLSLRLFTRQLNDDRVVVGACGSDMKVIPLCTLNGGQLVVGACGSDMNVIPSCSLNGGQPVAGACRSDTRGSNMNVIPSCVLNGDRIWSGQLYSAIVFPLCLQTSYMCSWAYSH